MYSLIIVDYNSLEKTIAYVKLCKQFLGSAGAAHVVVVENGAPPQADEHLSAAFGLPTQLSVAHRTVCKYEADGQTVLYCHSGENLGYARGNNLGVELAEALWHDPFYIISNNDLVFDAPLDLSVIDALFSSQPQVALVGPRVVTPAGEVQSPRCWQSAFRRLIANYWISASGSLLGAEKQQKLWDKYCNDTPSQAPSGPCDWISGCFMFVRGDAFRAAGMFDPHTFLFAEEMILAKRLEQIGSHVYFCREVEVIHKHGQTVKRSLDILRSIAIEFESNCYFYKHYCGTSGIMLACAKASFWLFSALFRCKNKEK